MGMRLPFRNMYHKGMYTFLGDKPTTRPEEDSGLFSWADHHPIITFSLSPLERSPHPPHVLFLTLHVHILCLLFLILLYVSVFFFLFHFTLPRVHFLPTCVGLVPSFSHPQQCKLTQKSCFIPLQLPFHNACSTNHSNLIPQFTQL